MMIASDITSNKPVKLDWRVFKQTYVDNTALSVVRMCSVPCAVNVLNNDIDLLKPAAELEQQKHKLKRLVYSRNSFFMVVKCQGFITSQLCSHTLRLWFFALPALLPCARPLVVDLI
jgi:hypothetical protein